MKFPLVVAATSALVSGSVLGESADCLGDRCSKPNWTPPCGDARTVTKIWTVFETPGTVDITATRTNYHTRTTDGIFRISRTTAVSTVRTSTQVTSTITAFRTVATSTRTFTRTSTVPKPWGFLPAKDTVHGFPEEYEYEKRDVVNTEIIAAEEARETKNHDYPEHWEGKPRTPGQPWEPEHHYPFTHTGYDGTVTIERVRTITPACVTRTHYQTITRTTKFVPTTVVTTEHFSRTTTITNRNTRRTTITIPTTITRYTTTTSPYYAACATNNILLNGPEGHTIANVFNNGRRHASSYDVAQGLIKTPYECCAVCQRSSTCEGSVFNPETKVCLLLRREDRTCGPQCKNPVEYITDPENRGVGLAVSNGQCGYLYFGGHSKPGVPPYSGKAVGKVRGPGL